MKKTLLLTMLVLVSKLILAQMPTSGLASFYSFNDSTVNDQFSDNHGINNGAVFAADRFGNPNSAVYFGGSAYIDCGDSVEFDLTYQPGITISCWTKQNIFFSSLQGIVTKWNQSTFIEQYGLWATSNDQFLAFGQLASNGYTVTSNVSNAVWHHLVMTYDTTSGIAKLYADGTEISSTALGAFPGSSGTNNLSIGAQKSNTNGSAGSISRYFTGYIDDVRIYKRAIDSSEVAALLYEPNPAFDISNAATSSNSPICIDETASISIANSENDVAYYLMNGSTIVDGPTAGNGSTINFTTDPLSTNTSFYIHGTHHDSEPDYDNTAIQFDGMDDYISTTLDSTFRYDTAYTVEAWVKVPHPSSSIYPTVFSISNNDSTDIEIYVQNTTNDLIVVHNRGKISGFGGHGFTDPPNDEWFHLAVSYDGTDVNVYYNGVLQSVVQATNPLQPVTRSANAGAEIGYINSTSFIWNSYYNGSIDNMRVWNSARTQTQIEENMYDCLSGNETGLVRLYKFDDGLNSSIATDYAISAADGSLMNMDSSSAWIPSAAAQCGMNLFPSITIQVEDCDTIVDGISTLTPDLLTAYPNPTTGRIAIGGVEQLVSIDVIDMLGQVLLTEKSTVIDLTPFENGMYMLKINAKGGTETLRVLKR